MYRFSIHSADGSLIFRDSGLKYPQSVDLKHAAISNFFLYLIADDESNYEIAVIVGDWPNELPSSKYEPFGGYFGLDLSSGCLEICTKSSWEKGLCESSVGLTSGYYVINTWVENTEYENYRNNIVAITSEEEMKYYELVNKFAVYAWIPILLLVISLLFPLGKEFWIYSLSIVIISWLPYYILRKTKQYLSIEQAMKEYQSCYPNYIVQIQKRPKETQIPGGYVYF